MELDTVMVGDCLSITAGLPDSSVNLIVSDWPYYRVKSEDWDRQWKTPAEYLDWIGAVCEQYRRVLAPNGSLYAFASPEMAARVECVVREWFEVVNFITWAKPEFSTKAEMFDKGTMRSYFPSSERIIFAEHYGADSQAKGVSGYGAKCDELHGFVFEPLRAYLDGERRRAGLRIGDMNLVCGTTFNQRNTNTCPIQWCMITEKKYKNLQLAYPGFFIRSYKDLRAEYEDLRAEYEDLRRPFNASIDAPYTDVWTFPTVGTYPGKHPCEKPLALIEHIINMSSRPGDLVCDFFMGGGTTAVAAMRTGRRWFGCDVSPDYVRLANEQIEKTRLEMSQLKMPFT